MKSCVFCQIVAGHAQARIVYEHPRYLAFLDKRPITQGHIQLIPKAHYRWVYDVPEMGELFTVAKTIIRAIIPVLRADHCTVGAFGREVPHAHIWIVPQYSPTAAHMSEGIGRASTKTNDDELEARLRTALMK